MRHRDGLADEVLDQIRSAGSKIDAGGYTSPARHDLPGPHFQHERCDACLGEGLHPVVQVLDGREVVGGNQNGGAPVRADCIASEELL